MKAAHQIKTPPKWSDVVVCRFYPWGQHYTRMGVGNYEYMQRLQDCGQKYFKELDA